MKEIEAWLARDINGDIYLYPEKPQKEYYEWSAPGTICIGFLKLDERLFPEVKWSDEEPTKVKLVIEK